jgi:hypothetical protein
MRKPNAVFRPMEGAAAIRATMGDGIRHLPEQSRIKSSLETGNAAHIDPLNIPSPTLALFFRSFRFQFWGTPFDFDALSPYNNRKGGDHA